MRRAFSVAIFARRGVHRLDGSKGEILLIHHRRLATWLPVGGEIEPSETPLEAAVRELREETGFEGNFPAITGAFQGVPNGYLGYEEHMAGSKGLHMNFIFVADIANDAVIRPNHEFSDFRWADHAALDLVEAPINVREFGHMALDAQTAAAQLSSPPPQG